MSVGLIGGRAELERYWRDDVGTQSYLTKNEAAALLNYIEQLEALRTAADDLPLWRLEDGDIPNDEFEAVTRFRAALLVLSRAADGQAGT